MLIKSNFKDYYDYLAGSYGIDPKAVYERVQGSTVSGKWVKQGYNPFLYLDVDNYLGGYKQFIIAFCGTLYYVFYYKGKIYQGNEYKLLPDNLRKTKCLDDYYYHNDKRTETEIFHLSKTDINEKENCPVMIVNLRHNDILEADIKNPKLSDFRFASFMPAEEAWLKITDFLLREKTIENKLTDIQKVEAHGFDKKTSFRNM